MTERFWAIEQKQVIGDYPSKTGRIATVTNEDYLEQFSWTSLRTQASFAMPCANCGTTEKVHQHHVKHVRKRAYALIPDTMTYNQVLALRNRKQIPLCANCHRNIVHAGKYDGQGLMKLAPQKLFDNRTLHIESYVKPGVVYHSKELEERGWKKVNTINLTDQQIITNDETNN